MSTYVHIHGHILAGNHDVDSDMSLHFIANSKLQNPKNLNPNPQNKKNNKKTLPSCGQQPQLHQQKLEIRAVRTRREALQRLTDFTRETRCDPTS